MNALSTWQYSNSSQFGREGEYEVPIKDARKWLMA